MKYKIDPNLRPLYMQIYRQMRDDIIRNVYPYGTKIPSKRLLSDECGVSTVTVEHAYALLCDEGYIEAREKSGFFVCFRNNDGFASNSSQVTFSKSNTENHKEAQKTHSVQQTSFPFSVLSKTMRKVLSEQNDNVLKKSPGKGCFELREAIKNYLLRNRGIKTESEQIVIGSGAEYLYGLIIELLGRDRVYGIEYPSYNKIRAVYNAYEAKFELLPFDKDGISSDALKTSSASVLHTTPYHSFPTGVTASATKRHEYIRWANIGDRYVIEDDFESEFSVSSKPEDTLFSLSECENIIYLNTFSKTISPSMRVGYMVLPAPLADKFDKKLGFYSCTVPTFEQLVIAELINNGSFERHINRVRRNKRKNT